ncbi:hypothetical protein Thal_0827 [Thermocrinis albus DSM 14484]|uniref:Uncharacterized protein n=1 Tax=Thermocrinis albus (strain DSM 14484 / JCM 11386 / HI 11/12) TaxID=638303 RepID=D3SL30_THEAH|nr:hypothetical protein [Thermocrinis albus]ADC89460.1 hypothetical protein Thal_0827 [Thermocrinis albus DSM 14484]
MRKIKVFLTALLITGHMTLAQQENTYLVPERVNPRIDTVVQVAKELKERGYNRIAVVYMAQSDLCALTAASLVASLKTLGLQAYYLKGNDPQLVQKIRQLSPQWIYIAYYGERPHQEVQSALNEDLKRLAEGMDRANIIVHPSTLTLGFLQGTLVDEKVAQFLERSTIKGFYIEDKKPVFSSVVVKDLTISIQPEKMPAVKKRKR